MIPRAPAARQRSPSADRIFGRVEAAEGQQSPLAFPGPGEHAVVRQTVGGCALGIVQREHAGPARAGVVEQCEQLWQAERAPVLVEPEMRVGVEDLGAGGTQALHLGQEWGEGVGVEG